VNRALAGFDALYTASVAHVDAGGLNPSIDLNPQPLGCCRETIHNTVGIGMAVQGAEGADNKVVGVNLGQQVLDTRRVQELDGNAQALLNPGVGLELLSIWGIVTDKEVSVLPKIGGGAGLVLKVLEDIQALQ